LPTQSRHLDSFAPAQSASRPARLSRSLPAARLWPKDESLEDSANLPAPDIIAAEVAKDLIHSLRGTQSADVWRTQPHVGSASQHVVAMNPNFPAVAHSPVPGSPDVIAAPSVVARPTDVVRTVADGHAHRAAVAVTGIAVAWATIVAGTRVVPRPVSGRSIIPGAVARSIVIGAASYRPGEANGAEPKNRASAREREKPR